MTDESETVRALSRGTGAVPLGREPGGLGDAGPSPMERWQDMAKPRLSRDGVITYPHPAGVAELRRPEPIFDESTVGAFVGLPVTWTEGES